MKIREAKQSDKNTVLEFCKNTFSWGDYIQDVWNYWIDEGNLFVIEQEKPVGVCHGYLKNNRIWIEGIRIHQSVRRQGLASKLVSNLESLAKSRGIYSSLMLIDTENCSSLCMAKQLGYEITETWKFYTLLPKQIKNTSVKFGTGIDKNLLSQYVKSWRWIKLDDVTINSLSKNHKIIFSNEDDHISFAILSDSEHFTKTLIVTLYSGSEKNTVNLISYLQNYGFENNYVRLQLLTREVLPEIKNLEYRISFYLMHKRLG